MFVKAHGAAVYGVNAISIDIEVSVSNGSHFFLVGLPDNAVKESAQRIQAAIRNIGYKFPVKRYIVNLSPADIRKEGSAYDLPIAIALLSATDQIGNDKLEKYMIMGELSLDGTILPVKGALPIAIRARQEGFEGLILPEANAQEAAVVDQLNVYGVSSLQEVIGLLEGSTFLQPTVIDTREEFIHQVQQMTIDFSEVKGQENIKRAMEIAAAGGHNLILVGPPGAGKTMLAKRLPTILPPLSLAEALETTKIHSVAGKLGKQKGLISMRPFRSPHHTISDVALVGGGVTPQPGEISLAHNGVLFLDELPEFKRSVLEVLRQPLEDRVVTISRAKFTIDYPSAFLLIASMNPCHCGNFNNPNKECCCPPGSVQRYLNRISGPLMDRIDLHVEVTPVPFRELSSVKTGESSLQIRERVISAREIQNIRYENTEDVHCNAQLSSRLVREYCRINTASVQLLDTAMEKLKLSARAYDRILKVARTIADLAASEDIKVEHLAEAIQYRSLDREGWGK